ncbi:hypothetical protein [Kribbella sp. NPDC049584]|uniref:hypothetical protein n=1 Tax=Kribbella sp. NPDC049584 TaxID=3154833 RepID=UPI003412B0EE
MITTALQQLAGLFSRRFFFNALLPTFVFTTVTSLIFVIAWWPTNLSVASWAHVDLLTKLIGIFIYFAVIYFLAAGVASQWRGIVRLFEGYPFIAKPNSARLAYFNGQTRHRTMMDRLQSEEYGDPASAYYLYPMEDYRDQVLSTRLGNILLAGERYANSRYQIETIYFWPRIYPLLPEAFQRDYEAAVIQYQFPLVVAFQAGVSTVVCALALLFAHSSAWTFVAVVVGGSLVASVAYKASLSSAIEVAEQQRAAFDLYRDRLLLSWPSVADVMDERAAFSDIKLFILWNKQPEWAEPHRRYSKRRQ